MYENNTVSELKEAMKVMLRWVREKTPIILWFIDHEPTLRLSKNNKIYGQLTSVTRNSFTLIPRGTDKARSFAFTQPHIGHYCCDDSQVNFAEWNFTLVVDTGKY